MTHGTSGPYVAHVTTHHMIERGESIPCGTSCSAATLVEAVLQAADEFERVPESDGRGAKILSVVDDAGREVLRMEHDGAWTRRLSERALRKAQWCARRAAALPRT